MKKIKLSKLDEVIYEETLDNGLKVFIYKMKGFVKKYACFETRYGSINNNFAPEGSDTLERFPLGIAHFLEHKLFESNENENVFKVFEDNGAYVNAATSYEKTYYYFDTVDNFDKCLTTLIDFVQSPYFTDETVEKEKGIIGQEMDMRHDNTNLFLYEKLINNGLNNIYYKDSIIGTKSSIDKITKEDLYKCYNTFYNPSNMYLVIVGDIDEEKTLSLIKENQSKKEFKKNINIKQEEKEEPLSIRVKEKVYKTINKQEKSDIKFYKKLDEYKSKYKKDINISLMERYDIFLKSINESNLVGVDNLGYITNLKRILFTKEEQDNKLNVTFVKNNETDKSSIIVVFNEESLKNVDTNIYYYSNVSQSKGLHLTTKEELTSYFKDKILEYIDENDTLIISKNKKGYSNNNLYNKEVKQDYVVQVKTDEFIYGNYYNLKDNLNIINFMDKNYNNQTTNNTNISFCPNCGTQINDGIKYCPKCGNEIK